MLHNIFRNALVAFSVLMWVLTSGCERDFSAHPAQQDLRFSADTLSFDTIFVGQSTPTGHITLINDGADDVSIANFALMGGEGSPFSVNVNGLPIDQAANLRLASGDSLYIFACLKNPTAEAGRAMSIVSDQIVVSDGANVWTAILWASVMNVTKCSGIITNREEWLCDSIPYWIQDTLTVGPEATLFLGPGVSLLMNGAAAISVEGHLYADGLTEAPVYIKHVRPDDFYDDIPGQWDGLHVLSNGQLTLFDTFVECSTNGIRVDSAATLKAHNLWVRHTSLSAISARKANVSLVNTLLTTCGSSALALQGGTTSLLHVTIADYFSWDYRHDPAFSFSPQDTTEVPEPTSLSVANSIIVGNLSDEILPDSLPAEGVLFQNTLLRTSKKDAINKDTVRFVNCVVTTDANFQDRANLDFHLTQKSKAVGMADINLANPAPLDFEGVMRLVTDSVQAGALQTVAY